MDANSNQKNKCPNFETPTGCIDNPIMISSELIDNQRGTIFCQFHECKKRSVDVSVQPKS